MRSIRSRIATDKYVEIGAVKSYNLLTAKENGCLYLEN